MRTCRKPASDGSHSFGQKVEGSDEALHDLLEPPLRPWTCAVSFVCPGRVGWRGLTKMKSTRGSEGSWRSVSPSAPFEPSGDWEVLERAGDVARRRLWSLPRRLLGDGWRSWSPGTERLGTPSLSPEFHVAEGCQVCACRRVRLGLSLGQRWTADLHEQPC
jgi:hypothetical protein